MLRWYVAETEYRSENLAARELAARGFDAFVPVMHGQRGRMIVAFPCYALVRLDVRLEGWQDAARTRGVKRLLGVNGPVALPDDIATRLMTPLGEALRVGDRAQVTEGSWIGMIGQVRSANDRVALLIELLGRQVELILPRKSVRKV